MSLQTLIDRFFNVRTMAFPVDRILLYGPRNWLIISPYKLADVSVRADTKPKARRNARPKAFIA